VRERHFEIRVGHDTVKGKWLEDTSAQVENGVGKENIKKPGPVFFTINSLELKSNKSFVRAKKKAKKRALSNHTKKGEKKKEEEEKRGSSSQRNLVC